MPSTASSNPTHCSGLTPILRDNPRCTSRSELVDLSLGQLSGIAMGAIQAMIELLNRRISIITTNL